MMMPKDFRDHSDEIDVYALTSIAAVIRLVGGYICVNPKQVPVVESDRSAVADSLLISSNRLRGDRQTAIALRWLPDWLHSSAVVGAD
jgi:hypothetical protein